MTEGWERPELKAGVDVKLQNGSNIYTIVKREERHLHLECVYFGGSEDLGDGITCDEQGELVWIAMYFGAHMKLLPPAFGS